VGDITEVLGRELKTLREDEQRRGDAALERLSALEGRVAEHLVSLGSELQGPMSELIATASEAPQAAARVIAQLREEISNNIERDNNLLQERRDIFEQLERLSASLQSSSEGQQEAVTRLLETSESMLGEAGGRFAERVDAESEKLASVASDVNDQFAGSAVELASLGEAFGVAVEQFNQSNQKLAESFASIETALQQSGARSDEQMGYYVAQARDIIDHSVLSQKQMLEELRQFGRQDELNLTAAAEA
jgi:seryl-tRNA synthetase